jgi:hypothetical protein
MAMLNNQMVYIYIHHPATGPSTQSPPRNVAVLLLLLQLCFLRAVVKNKERLPMKSWGKSWPYPLVNLEKAIENCHL